MLVLIINFYRNLSILFKFFLKNIEKVLTRADKRDKMLRLWKNVLIEKMESTLYSSLRLFADKRQRNYRFAETSVSRKLLFRSPEGGEKMVEIINKYETMFIVDASRTDEEIASLVDKFRTLIEANGEIDSVDEWGKRRLAYPINDLIEGYYVLVNFTSNPEFPKELDRVYRITSGILRTIIIKKDA